VSRGCLIGRRVRYYIGTPVADAASLSALPIGDDRHADGCICVKLDDSTLWVYDTASVLAAGANVIASTYGPGRWLDAAGLELASTANGDGASLVGIEDAATKFDATDVEGALAELVATSTGDGASLIGIEDVADYFTGGEVETALAELGAFKPIKRTVTITSADLDTAGTGPETETIGAVLPQTAVVVAYRISLTDAFDNGAGVSLVLEVGHSNDVDAYEDAFDCFTGSALEGSGWVYVTPGPGIGAPAWNGTSVGQCVATFTAGADQLANFTGGSVTIEIIALDVA